MQASDWAARYREDDIPWDQGRAHPELDRLIEYGHLDLPGGTALVPGCGNGHDALALARAGWKVTALDFAEEPVASLAPQLEAHGGEARVEDAFEHRGQYDLLFEHTFFCAIDPSDRPRWGEFAARNLKPGGRLVMILVPVGKPAEDGGPPFGVDQDAVTEVLGERFLLRIADPCERVIGKRSYPEHLLVFERAPFDV